MHGLIGGAMHGLQQIKRGVALRLGRSVVHHLTCCPIQLRLKPIIGGPDRDHHHQRWTFEGREFNPLNRHHVPIACETAFSLLGTAKPNR
jgi:hypothetical protein